jgi:hypothetical protein
MIRDPRPAGRAPLVLALIVAGIMIGINIKARADELVTAYPHLHEDNPFAASRPTQWPGAIVIDVEASAEPFRPYIQYAAWQWAERTGRKITVTPGASPAGYSSSGRITISASLSLPATVAGRTQLWHWMDTGNIAGATISISPLALCHQQTITHEIGHAIGILGHTESPHDVMYPTQQHCRHALSAADVNAAPYDSNACFVELTARGDLYIPHIHGHAALLAKDGDGWRLAEYVPATGCTTVAAVGMDLTFGDIRSQAGNFRGWLRYVGGERWVLGGVE